MHPSIFPSNSKGKAWVQLYKLIIGQVMKNTRPKESRSVFYCLFQGCELSPSQNLNLEIKELPRKWLRYNYLCPCWEEKWSVSTMCIIELLPKTYLLYSYHQDAASSFPSLMPFSLCNKIFQEILFHSSTREAEYYPKNSLFVEVIMKEANIWNC